MIKKTTDYNKFKRIKGNRVPLAIHVDKLRKSIAENNLLAVNPIIVNKDMEVIDGQHRLMVARELNIPVYYAVSDVDLSIKDIIRLNTYTQKWAVLDFVKSYVEVGYEDYKIWKEFMERFDIKPSMASVILRMTPDTTSIPTYDTRAIRNGTYKVGDLATAIEFVDKLKQLEPYTEYRTTGQRDFVNSIILLTTKHGYTFEELINFVKKYDKKLRPQARRIEHMRQWEDVISYVTHNRPRLY